MSSGGGAQDKLVVTVCFPVQSSKVAFAGLVVVGLGDTLQKMAARACRTGHAADLGVIAQAVAMAQGRELGAVVSALLEGLRGSCPGYPLDKVFQALLQLGKGPSRAVEVLIVQMRTRGARLERRVLAARTLSKWRAPLGSADARLARALLRKWHLLTSGPTPQRLPPAAVAFRLRVRRSWNVCRMEAGLPSAAATPPEAAFATASGLRALSKLRDCLDATVCGPTSARARAPLRRCCSKAWPGRAPQWCR